MSVGLIFSFYRKIIRLSTKDHENDTKRVQRDTVSTFLDTGRHKKAPCWELFVYFVLLYFPDEPNAPEPRSEPNDLSVSFETSATFITGTSITTACAIAL